MPWQLHTVVLLMLVLYSAISMVTCRTVEVDILTPTSWTSGGDTRSSSKAAYLSQLSEYLFDHSPGTFFRFVDHLCSSSSSSSSSSSRLRRLSRLRALHIYRYIGVYRGYTYGAVGGRVWL